MSLLNESITRIKSIPSTLAKALKIKQFNHITSFFVLTAIIPAVYLPLIVPAASSEGAYNSTLTLDTTANSAVVSKRELPKVVPGESAEQKQAREKAEAAARAVAQMSIRAKAATPKVTVTKLYTDADLDQIYQRAQNAYGVDARILKAIHTVESGRRTAPTGAVSSAGATGPMQFLPSTFRRHAVDGNGDGVLDINNVEDAIFTAAAYLRACGYPDVKKALWGYNPSFRYYNKVMGIAHELGF
jgi:membrane-bound lytic murein transglycosylase B